MIPFLDLKAINKRFENEFDDVFKSFLNSGQYIGGDYVKTFENEFAHFCGTNYCIGASNGLDALTLIFKAYISLGKLKIGDEVLVPANTFIASVLAIVNSGLKPVFVEPNKATFNVDSVSFKKAITNKTKAILVVHLYGQLCDVSELKAYANQEKLLIIEDAAQAHGAINKGEIKAGNLGDATAFSFYPAKNLGALGDAGAVTTNDKDLSSRIQVLGNYGSEIKYENKFIGHNHRLDPLQAAFLRIKIKQLDADNSKRVEIAKKYLSHINNPKIQLPYYSGLKDHVFHLFVILVENRDEFITYLKANEIEVGIHYPIPPHKQEALKEFNYLSFPITEYIHGHCVSLPISPLLKDEDVFKIIKIINNY